MPRRFCVIGYPIGHSMSPYIHRRLFVMSKTLAEYNCICVSPEELPSRFQDLSCLDGFNVTIPHKHAIIDLLDSLDEYAKSCGSVNTVFKGRGYNTDGFGFREALRLSGIPLAGNVLICGAGGVARTFAFEANAAGCRITLAVRHGSRAAAEKLCRDIGISADITTLSEVKGPFDLIINATSCGMFPNTDCSPLRAEQMVGSRAAFDAVYNPRDTLFLNYARQGGLTCSGGMSMLVMQAAKAHEIWYGASFDDNSLSELIDGASAEMISIFGGRV